MRLTLLFLLFYNSVGYTQTLFYKTYGTDYNDVGEDFVKTPDSGFLIVGWTEYLSANASILVMKTDSLGDMEWVKTYGDPFGNDQKAYKIRPAGDGNYLVACAYHTGDSGLTPSNNLILKIDPSGDTLWTQGYGCRLTMDIPSSTVVGLEVLPDGRFVIASNSICYEDTSFNTFEPSMYISMFDSSGTQLWGKSILSTVILQTSANSMCLTSDSGIVVVGQIQTSTGFDAFVVKFNFNGDTLWTRTYDHSNDQDNALSVVELSPDTIVFTMYSGFIHSILSLGQNGTQGNVKYYNINGDKRLTVGANNIYGTTGGTQFSVFNNRLEIVHSEILGRVMNSIKETEKYIDFVGTTSWDWSGIPLDIWLMQIDTFYNASCAKYPWEPLIKTATFTTGSGASITDTIRANETSLEIKDRTSVFVQSDDCYATSIEEYAKANHTLLVYPNPTHDLIYATIENVQTIEKLTIYNEVGSIVYTSVNHIGVKTVQLDYLPSGVYFVSAEHNNQSVYSKLIKL